MKIKRLSQYKGACGARGTAVIIDVFRAFTCEPLMHHLGVRRILLESDIERCLDMAGEVLLVGERDGRMIDGFDLGNSPWEIMKAGRAFFEGRTVVHRTTSGVTGATAALERAEEVLLASFVNARSTAEYIASSLPDTVSIVAMGVVGDQSTLEDEYCGDYIESLLTGKPYDHISALSDILADETAQKFLRGDRDYYPAEDPGICLQRDLFDFALRVRKCDNVILSEPVRAP